LNSVPEKFEFSEPRDERRYLCAITLSVTLLGTGSPLPDPNRAGPATLIRAEGVQVLCDAGRNVVPRLAAAGSLPLFLDAVLLTHLHSDHICDLNDVLTTRWVMSPGPNPLRIFGPVGTSGVVEGILQMLAPDIHYRLTHHADLNDPPGPVVTEVQPGERFEIGPLVVRVGATDHRPVTPTVGYRVSLGDTSVVLAGDGVSCATLDDLVRGATGYVQTVIRDDLVRAVPNARFHDVCDYHSTVQQAADTAQRAGVGTLILTHFVPASAIGKCDEWRGLASDFTGQLVTGDDLTTVELSA
jgi:ribonuclease Z